MRQLSILSLLPLYQCSDCPKCHADVTRRTVVNQTDICLDACVAGDINGACATPTEDQTPSAQVGWRGCTPGAARQNWTLTPDGATDESEVSCCGQDSLPYFRPVCSLFYVAYIDHAGLAEQLRMGPHVYNRQWRANVWARHRLVAEGAKSRMPSRQTAAFAEVNTCSLLRIANKMSPGTCVSLSRPRALRPPPTRAVGGGAWHVGWRVLPYCRRHRVPSWLSPTARCSAPL